MIPNEQKESMILLSLWALIRGITSKHIADFYCLNCVCSFEMKKTSIYEKVCKKKQVCGILLLFQKKNIRI